MIKKVVMAVSSAAIAGVLLLASSVDTKAALSCTYDIINDANGDIAANSASLAQAQANEAALLAQFNAIKADPNHSQLAYEQAFFNYQNAANVTKWWLAQVNNSKEFLKNIKDREGFEDKFADNKEKLANLTKLKDAKFQADIAKEVANSAAGQVADVEKALAGYQVQVLSYPSMQAQIDQLIPRLEALKADYAAKAAVASEKEALFNTYLNTLNYQGYSLGFEDYQHNREWQRSEDGQGGSDLWWDPEHPKNYNY